MPVASILSYFIQHGLVPFGAVPVRLEGSDVDVELRKGSHILKRLRIARLATITGAGLSQLEKARPEALAGSVRRAIERTVELLSSLQPQQRTVMNSRLTVVLDARSHPTRLTSMVAEEFLRGNAGWATSLGFEAIWLVGAASITKLA